MKPLLKLSEILDYKKEIAKEFISILIDEGGDDDFATYEVNEVLPLLTYHITAYHCLTYHQKINEALDIYLDIKETYLLRILETLGIAEHSIKS